jgi:hypothetical protein
MPFFACTPAPPTPDVSSNASASTRVASHAKPGPRGGRVSDDEFQESVEQWREMWVIDKENQVLVWHEDGKLSPCRPLGPP